MTILVEFVTEVCHTVVYHIYAVLLHAQFGPALFHVVQYVVNLATFPYSPKRSIFNGFFRCPVAAAMKIVFDEKSSGLCNVSPLFVLRALIVIHRSTRRVPAMGGPGSGRARVGDVHRTIRQGVACACTGEVWPERLSAHPQFLL